MSEFVTELVDFVISYGLDKYAGISIDGGGVDLAPVLATLQELNSHSSNLFTAISRPTQTASEEMAERAVIAYSAGWFDDSLRDAQASIEMYPYTARPRLVGGLAALMLGRGEIGLDLLVSAVKYSKNGQPEIGAIAALVASRVASAVGGKNLAQSLLQEADTVTNGRCPAIVGALWRHGVVVPQASPEQRLKDLWWQEHGTTLTYSQEGFEKLLTATTTPGPDYLTAGTSFQDYLDDIAQKVGAAQSAHQALLIQLGRFHDRRKMQMDDWSVKKALSYTTLGLKIGLWDSTGAAILKKCRTLADTPDWPGDSVWHEPTRALPADALNLFTYVHGASELLIAALREVRTRAEETRETPHHQQMVDGRPNIEKWITAVAFIQETADMEIAREAAGTLQVMLADRPLSSAAPVLHLDRVSAGLFEQIGNQINAGPTHPLIIDMEADPVPRQAVHEKGGEGFSTQ
ncbi:hypothetical protein [Kineosporia babensis]|uniref:Uncharacterized protein n=1 Tax=Kineosporia babensis TaxID=499548 RepID=A0A9X1NMS4_9ACTN|nr:hypothetical protein [Kineosporia babensis]MCD5317250.1 hypothetical protein [Kineosporia babensis]